MQSAYIQNGKTQLSSTLSNSLGIQMTSGQEFCFQCQGEGFDHDCPTFLLPVGLVFPLVSSRQESGHDCPMFLLPAGLF